MGERIEGTIIHWNHDKGFGFIVDDAETRYFAHYYKFKPESDPRVGDKVSFEVINTDNGLRGVDIVITEQADEYDGEGEEEEKVEKEKEDNPYHRDRFKESYRSMASASGESWKDLLRDLKKDLPEK